jgi:hypothetical protein
VESLQHHQDIPYSFPLQIRIILPMHFVPIPDF